MLKKLFAIAAIFALSLSVGCNGCSNGPDKNPPAPTPSASQSATAPAPGSKDAAPAAGSPIVPQEGKPGNIGKASISSKWLKFEEPVLCSFTNFAGIAAPEKNVIVLAQKKELAAYRIDGDVLKPEKSYFDNGVLELPFTISLINMDKNGLMYVSGGVFNVATVNKKGIVAKDHDANGYFYAHPSGKWGLSCFVGSDTRFFDRVGDSSFVSKKWILSDMGKKDARKGKYSSVDCFEIREDVVLVSGNVDKEVAGKNPGEKKMMTGKIITVYDSKGKEMLEFERTWDDPFAKDHIGWVYSMFGSSYGTFVVDSNFRSLKLFGKDGKYIGQEKLKDLLGADMWPKSTARLDSKTVAIAGSVKRPKINPDDENEKPVSEIMVFLLKGI